MSRPKTFVGTSGWKPAHYTCPCAACVLARQGTAAERVEAWRRRERARELGLPADSSAAEIAEAEQRKAVTP